jgi:hypothetical protein
MDNKFKIEVKADSGGKWAGNAMVYDTFGEAKDAAIDLANRWMLVTAAQVVEFNNSGLGHHDIIKSTIVW